MWPSKMMILSVGNDDLIHGNIVLFYLGQLMLYEQHFFTAVIKNLNSMILSGEPGLSFFSQVPLFHQGLWSI